MDENREGTSPNTASDKWPSGNPLFSFDHRFILQVVMELRGTTAQLTTSVNLLSTQLEKQANATEKHANELRGMSDKLSGVTHKIYAAGMVLTMLVGIGGFIVSKAWDAIFQVAKPVLMP
jgi:hypothetical protein